MTTAAAQDLPTQEEIAASLEDAAQHYEASAQTAEARNLNRQALADELHAEACRHEKAGHTALAAATSRTAFDADSNAESYRRQAKGHRAEAEKRRTALAELYGKKAEHLDDHADQIECDADRYTEAAADLRQKAGGRHHKGQRILDQPDDERDMAAFDNHNAAARSLNQAAEEQDELAQQANEEAQELRRQATAARGDQAHNQAWAEKHREHQDSLEKHITSQQPTKATKARQAFNQITGEYNLALVKYYEAQAETEERKKQTELDHRAARSAETELDKARTEMERAAANEASTQRDPKAEDFLKNQATRARQHAVDNYTLALITYNKADEQRSISEAAEEEARGIQAIAKTELDKLQTRLAEHANAIAVEER